MNGFQCSPDRGFPPWVMMWLLAGVLFVAGKFVMLLRIRRRSPGRWPKWKVAAWFCLWPGMNPRDFDSGGQEPPRSLAFALAKIAAGTFLLWLGARQFANTLAAGWCGMIGLILLLHFGIFEFLAIFWQARGLRAKAIMDFPAGALSVSEFWGLRWNTAFRDLTYPLMFVPLARRWGTSTATWASFGISGLAHELVISVPAGAGYGLPTAYFLLQALGINLERKLSEGRGRFQRWLLTHSLSALPAFFLFHPPFVERVMVPFFHAIGALP